MRRKDISIIIPVYFNEGTIKETYRLLMEEILVKFNLQFEIIFIDDGSSDGSYEEMCALKEIDKSITLLRFTRNFGQVAAIYAGYEFATGKGILNLSADLQEPPELVVSMIHSYMKNEAKIIAGIRIDREESFYRKKTSQLFYYFMKKLSFSNMPSGGFDISLIDHEVKKVILNLKESNPFWQGQILWSGYSVKFVPYNRQKRKIGKSRWTFDKKVKYLLDGVLNYSYYPLRFISLFGIISFFIGIIYSIIIVLSYFLGNAPYKGWSAIMIVILLFSGLQLMMTGLLGEYLWRVFEQIKNNPQYIIKDKK